MTVKRLTLMQELLTFVGLDGRVHLDWISSAEAQKFVDTITEFTEKIRSLGPNPLARFTQAWHPELPETGVPDTPVHLGGKGR